MKEKIKLADSEVRKFLVTKIVTAASMREAAQIAQTEGRVVTISELDKDFEDYDD